MSSRVAALAAIVVSLALPPRATAREVGPGILKLDPAKTSIAFRLPGVLHTTHGTFKLLRGEIKADPATGDAEGSILVDASSGNTGVSARDRRMKESVLEVDKYPEITLTARRVTGHLAGDGLFHAQFQGTITLHGLEHQISFAVDGKLTGDDLVATAHFSVPYVQWGLEDPSILMFTVAKRVDIDINAVGQVTWIAQSDYRDKIESRPN